MAADNTAGITAFIGLGSNLGDSKMILQGAWEALGGVAGIHCVKLSRPYLSEPVDMTSQHWFTNSVGRIATTLEPLALLGHLMRLEAEFGRVRDENVFGLQDRSLDLDLLYFGDTILDIPELILPHPRIYERLFVMMPMVEIAPEFVDCVRDKTIRELHAALVSQIESGVVKKQEIVSSSWQN